VASSDGLAKNVSHAGWSALTLMDDEAGRQAPMNGLRDVSSLVEPESGGDDESYCSIFVYFITLTNYGHEVD
jgi:hypothetical protein